MDAAVERTGMYLQGELRSKRGSSRGASRNVPFLTFCPGVQRVQKTYVNQLLYSLVYRRYSEAEYAIMAFSKQLAINLTNSDSLENV
jgi:hypothetical protein